MPLFVFVGLVLAGPVLAGALLWHGWRTHAGAARRRGERVERKLDILLGYLALERERREIDAEGKRET